MKVKNTKEEPIYFNSYDSEALTDMIETQGKIIDHMKKEGSKKIHQVWVIIDDFADDPTFTRQSRILHALYTRGRHNMISTITSTQKFNAIHPIIRVNATELFVYRLRSTKDLETFIEEVSAVLDKKTLLEIYNKGTSEPHSFLYVKLTAHNKKDMFFVNFHKKMIIED